MSTLKESPLKQKQVFESSASFNDPTLAQRNNLDLKFTTRYQFDDNETFLPSAQQVEMENKSEKQLEQIIRPSNKTKWGTVAILSSFSALMVWQTADGIVSAAQTGDWLTLGWSGFIAVLASLGIGAFAKELWKLRKLRHHFSVQQQSEALLVNESVGKGVPFCEQMAKDASIIEESPCFERWKNSVNSAHSDADILQMYDAMVVTEQDKQATQIVSKIASESALLVAISPLAVADMLLVAWRSFSMIDQLAKIYGVELGYWSRLRLFKLVLLNMAMAGATEVAVDVGMDLLSMDMAAKLSTRVGQGIGVGLLTARLGIKAMALLRPIAWQQGKAVKLSEIRRHILANIKGKGLLS